MSFWVFLGCEEVEDKLASATFTFIQIMNRFYRFYAFYMFLTVLPGQKYVFILRKTKVLGSGFSSTHRIVKLLKQSARWILHLGLVGMAWNVFPSSHHPSTARLLFIFTFFPNLSMNLSSTTKANLLIANKHQNWIRTDPFDLLLISYVHRKNFSGFFFLTKSAIRTGKFPKYLPAYWN